nr:retrotransposon protein, putative, Ty1-copia subclass [Tanacetum cinerariifolium]
MIAQITSITAAREWYVDSGATIHVVRSRNSFITYRAVTGRQVMIANRDKADVCGVGTIQMKFTSGKTVNLHNVLHVPTISKSLVSVELMHLDICELNGILTRGGKRYFITFCDNSSRFLYVYLLRSKDEAFDSFKIYKAEVENQLGKKIKILRSNRGGEYFMREFDTFCEENGIKHERTSPYTPQQNGLAERKNRTLVEMVNCMLNQSGLPTNLWGKALLPACHIHNRITSRMIPMSPYELWNGRKPNLDYLRVWGCLAYYRTPKPKWSKLGARGIKSVFVGYVKNSKACSLLDENSGVIIESRDVELFEDKFSKDVKNPRASLVPTSTSSYPVEISTKINEPRRSTRARKEKKSMSSRDAPLWKEAINDETDSILGNQTWKLAELPKGVKPIGSKWVFKKKLNPDGSISAFKARLVTKGYIQREGLNYFDTYAPVTRISSIKTLIAISAIKDLYIHQMDVKTAFLNGYLHEEVYMEQPEGFVIQGKENKVCRLVKSLYDLKQVPKKWHERFDTTVIS